MRRVHLFALAAGIILIGGIAYASITSDVLAKFAQLEKYYNIPDGILAKVSKVESNGNASARNSIDAAGMFQWLPRSWYYASSALNKSQSGGQQGALQLSARYNPYLAAEVTAFALAEAKSKLGPQIQASGVDLTVGLYMTHFLGLGGATKFFSNMRQNPSAIASIAFAKEARYNPQVFGNSRTYVQVINYFASKLGQNGITSVSGYSGAAIDPNSSRIIDSNGLALLGQPYTGAVPPDDPSLTYQATPDTYSSPLPPGTPAQNQTAPPPAQPPLVPVSPGLQNYLNNATGSTQLSQYFLLSTSSSQHNATTSDSYYDFSALWTTAVSAIATGSQLTITATSTKALSGATSSTYQPSDGVTRVAAFGPDSTFSSNPVTPNYSGDTSNNISAIQSLLETLRSLLVQWLKQLQS